MVSVRLRLPKPCAQPRWIFVPEHPRLLSGKRDAFDDRDSGLFEEEVSSPETCHPRVSSNPRRSKEEIRATFQKGQADPKRDS